MWWHRLQTVVALFCCSASLLSQAVAGSPAVVATYRGSQWHMAGDGVVCCPCSSPCPCRHNAPPTYGHCEATLYLRVEKGYFEHTDLSGLQVVQTSGSCAMDYHNLAALYVDKAASKAQIAAFEQILASFSPTHIIHLSYVRPVEIDAAGDHDSLFKVAIPHILDMEADRKWGNANEPLPFVAAADNYSNLLQFAQNRRYRMSDAAAHLQFDYSRRQANYRSFDLGPEGHESHSMLIQFADGTGWFNPAQLAIIERQKLPLPDVEALKIRILELKSRNKAGQ